MRWDNGFTVGMYVQGYYERAVSAASDVVGMLLGALAVYSVAGTAMPSRVLLALARACRV